MSISNEWMKRFIEGNSRKCFERFHFTKWTKAENAERKTEQRKAHYNRAKRYFPRLSRFHFHTHTYKKKQILSTFNFIRFIIVYITNIRLRYFYLNILSEYLCTNNYLFTLVFFQMLRETWTCDKCWNFSRLLYILIIILFFECFTNIYNFVVKLR